MQILKVKDNGKNFKINDGEFFVPKENGRKDDIEAVQKWIDAGGTVDPEFTNSELKSNLVEKIKTQAATRIDSAYPEWQQRNYIAAVTEIHNKEIVAMKTIPFVAQYQLTPEELQTLKDAHTCKKFITNIRAKSNELEASLDSMTEEQLNAFDPSEDSNWE